MLTTIASFSLIARDLDRSLETTAQQPAVSRETEYYLENISNVKSIDEFIEDDRLFSYAMTAHGLSEMSYAKAFMRKALEEGIDANDTFANTLADRRYRDFVETSILPVTGRRRPPLPEPSRAPPISLSAKPWRSTPAPKTKACALHSTSSARPLN